MEVLKNKKAKRKKRRRRKEVEEVEVTKMPHTSESFPSFCTLVAPRFSHNTFAAALDEMGLAAGRRLPV